MTSSLTSLFRSTPESVRIRPAAGIGRGLAAAGVLMSADVHLVLYLDGGFSSIPVVGTAFLLNAVGGLVIGLAVLLWRIPVTALLAIAFGVATLTAYYISAIGTLFGVHETWGGTQVILAEVAEWVAIAGGLLALVVERRPARR